MIRTQEEYNIAKAQEEKQHDDMVTRMRMMYENDSSENYVNLLFQGGGLKRNAEPHGFRGEAGRI